MSSEMTSALSPKASRVQKPAISLTSETLTPSEEADLRRWADETHAYLREELAKRKVKEAVE